MSRTTPAVPADWLALTAPLSEGRDAAARFAELIRNEHPELADVIMSNLHQPLNTLVLECFRRALRVGEN